VPTTNCLDTKNREEINTQRKLTKSIAVLSVALMVVCLVPATFAAQDNNQEYNMHGKMHEKMSTGEPASFSLDNATFETKQERMLEQVNDTISKIESDIENIDELENENITEEMLTTALTQLEEAKTLIVDAEDEDDLKEAMELIHSTTEELGIEPQKEPGMGQRPMEDQGMLQGNESFETQQEKMLEHIESMISKLESDAENIDELDNENITAKMLDNATTQLEEAKTLVENSEDEEDLKEAMEMVHTAMESLGIGPAMMGRPEVVPEDETFETQQERMLEQINDTLTLIESDEFDNENVTAEMLDNATTQLEEAKTIVENAEDVDDLKEAGELIHSAMETLGMGPAMMDRPEALPEGETFETQQERMLEQINNTISKIESDIENIDELENENITEEMLTTALTQLEEVKTLINNAEDEEDLKEAMEQIHSAMEELGIGPENERGMERGPMGKPGMSPRNESSES